MDREPPRHISSDWRHASGSRASREPGVEEGEDVGDLDAVDAVEVGAGVTGEPGVEVREDVRDLDAVEAVEVGLAAQTADLQALERLPSQRTTFRITHNLSHALNADLILYLENGRIIERGTHTELMQARGRYAALYRLQTLSRSNTVESGPQALALGA